MDLGANVENFPLGAVTSIDQIKRLLYGIKVDGSSWIADDYLVKAQTESLQSRLYSTSASTTDFINLFGHKASYESAQEMILARPYSNFCSAEDKGVFTTLIKRTKQQLIFPLIDPLIGLLNSNGSYVLSDIFSNIKLQFRTSRYAF